MKNKLLLLVLALLISLNAGNNSILADAGFVDNSVSSNTTDQTTNGPTRNHFKVIQAAEVELAGNPQKPAIGPKGDFILVPAKDLNQLYYITIVNDAPVRNNFTIPTGEQPVDVVISSNGNRAYVANEGDKTITVIDLDEEDSEVLGKIDLNGKPKRLALNNNNGYLYTLNENEDTVTVIDLKDEDSEVVNVIPVGEGPYSIKLTENGTTAYVVNRGNNSVTEVDLTSPEGTTLRKPIPVGVYPTDIIISKDNSMALVTNALDNNISLFNPTLDQPFVFGNIGNLAKPFGIVYDSKGDCAVALSYYTGRLDFFDLQFASQGIVTELSHDPVTINEKPEYITLNNDGIIAITHPRKDVMSVILFDVEKEKIERPVNKTIEKAGNSDDFSNAIDVLKNIESENNNTEEANKEPESTEEIIDDVIQNKNDPTRGRIKAE